MGNASGLKAWQVLANAERVLAIELLAGAQGVEFLAPLQPGRRRARGARARPLALAAAARRPAAARGDIEAVADAIRDGSLVEAVEAEVGRAAREHRQRDEPEAAQVRRGRTATARSPTRRSARWSSSSRTRPAAASCRSLVGGVGRVRARDRVHVVAACARREAAGGAAVSATRSLDATVEALCGDLSAIRAPRGTELNARSWSTEAPLRMLLNNLDPEVAERPEELVVYGGSGQGGAQPRGAAGARPVAARRSARTRRCSSRAASRSASSARARPRRAC